MSEIVEYKGYGKGAFPFRAYPYGEAVDGHRTWQIEYMQNPKTGWGPRGVFEERDGAYYWLDQRFESVREVLAYRSLNP